MYKESTYAAVINKQFHSIKINEMDIKLVLHVFASQHVIKFLTQTNKHVYDWYFAM